MKKILSLTIVAVMLTIGANGAWATELAANKVSKVALATVSTVGNKVVTPEPSTWALFALGLVVMTGFALRRKFRFAK